MNDKKRTRPDLRDVSFASNLSRRDFFRTAGASAGAAAAALLAPGLWAHAADGIKRPKVGVIFTHFTYMSHAHVILENFLETGGPRDLTILSIGGQGGRGKVPGTIDELGRDGRR